MSIDWSKAGECELFGSASYEALDGDVDVGGRQVFLSYSKYLYEEMVNGTTFNGATIMATYSDVKARRACTLVS